MNSKPVFSSGTHTLSLDNAAAASVIYDADAYDNDGETLTYTLLDSINISVAGDEINGNITIAMFDDVAPLHVNRIETLVMEGAYNGVIFHRVIDGFMAQTGDVEYGKLEGGNLIYAGRGGSSKSDLPAEFSSIPFERGVVGMARSSEPNSANSQFFMMFEDYFSLNGSYTVFGQITAGLDVLDAIKRGDPYANGKVDVNPDYMANVTNSPVNDLFNINASSGTVSLNNAPDFKLFNAGEFVVSVSDGNENTYQTVKLSLPEQRIDISVYEPNGSKIQLSNQNIIFRDNFETTLSITNGTLAPISRDVSFTHIELSSQSYNRGISINDVVLQLRDIVGLDTLSDKQRTAADIDGNGSVGIGDVVSVLRHIVGLDTLKKCALIDSSDQLVKSLTTSTLADLEIIQYGNVDLSSSFTDIA